MGKSVATDTGAERNTKQGRKEAFCHKSPRTSQLEMSQRGRYLIIGSQAGDEEDRDQPSHKKRMKESKLYSDRVDCLRKQYFDITTTTNVH